MAERTAESMMDKTIEKIKAMVDANTIIGTPVQAGDVTVIPVSKVRPVVPTCPQKLRRENCSVAEAERG